MKRLPPALLAVCLATFLLAPPPAPAEARLDRFERSVVNQLNYLRVATGKRRLGVSSRLSRRAARHSRRMARGGRMFHARLRRGGEAVGWLRGRRIARRVVRMWLRSPAHRRALMSRGFHRIGVGRRRGGRGHFFTIRLAR
jgi:uncharacterized protein YkwD